MAKWFGYNAPFRQGLQNVLSLQADERLLKNDLLQLLLTAPGERVMRPTYGSPIRPFLFENMDQANLDTLRTNIEQAIKQFENRIKTTSVEVTPDEDNNRLDIKVYGFFNLAKDINDPAPVPSLLAELNIPIRTS